MKDPQKPNQLLTDHSFKKSSQSGEGPLAIVHNPRVCVRACVTEEETERERERETETGTQRER